MVSVRVEGRLRLGHPAITSVGGSESNVAIGLARLGHEVAWVGAVGADEPGELVVRTLRAGPRAARWPLRRRRPGTAPR